MSGDIRDRIIAIVKRLPKPWQKMSEQEQRTAINQAEIDSRDIVAKAVPLIAAEDRPFIVCRIEKVTIDDKGAKLSLSGIPAIDDEGLLDATRLHGQRVVLTLATHGRHVGERAPLKPEPDQGRLIPDKEAAGNA